MITLGMGNNKGVASLGTLAMTFSGAIQMVGNIKNGRGIRWQ